MPGNISWQKLVQKFRRLGFDGPYSGVRHLFMIRDKLKVRILNPHRGDIQGILSQKYCVRQILKQMSGKKYERRHMAQG